LLANNSFPAAGFLIGFISSVDDDGVAVSLILLLSDLESENPLSDDVALWVLGIVDLYVESAAVTFEPEESFSNTISSKGVFSTVEL